MVTVDPQAATEQAKTFPHVPQSETLFDFGTADTVILHGNRHSAHMHSTNVNNLTRYGKALDTAIFVKNGPSYAALGFGGEGYPTFTIASRTGEGLTSAKTFTKSRRCVMCDALCIR